MSEKQQSNGNELPEINNYSLDSEDGRKTADLF